MCELHEFRRSVTQREADARVAAFGEAFVVDGGCTPEELERAARTSVALDKLAEAHRLGSLAYYYAGAAGNAYEDIVTSVIAGNTLLTRRSLQRAKQNQATVMGTSGLRQVINLAALVLVYLLRKVVPLPLAGTLIGTAVGLSGGSIAGVWILARKMDDTIPAEGVEVPDAETAELPENTAQERTPDTDPADERRDDTNG